MIRALDEVVPDAGALVLARRRLAGDGRAAVLDAEHPGVGPVVDEVVGRDQRLALQQADAQAPEAPLGLDRGPLRLRGLGAALGQLPDPGEALVVQPPAHLRGDQIAQHRPQHRIGPGGRGDDQILVLVLRRHPLRRRPPVRLGGRPQRRHHRGPRSRPAPARPRPPAPPAARCRRDRRPRNFEDVAGASKDAGAYLTEGRGESAPGGGPRPLLRPRPRFGSMPIRRASSRWTRATRSTWPLAGKRS